MYLCFMLFIVSVWIQVKGGVNNNFYPMEGGVRIFFSMLEGGVKYFFRIILEIPQLSPNVYIATSLTIQIFVTNNVLH